MSLQADLDVVQQKIGDEKQKGAEQNKALVSQLEEQEAAILAQMDEEAKMQKEQAIELKVQEDIAFSITGVDLSAVPVEWMGVIELVVKADRRRIFAEHAVEIEQVENEYMAAIENSAAITSNLDNLKVQFSSLEEEYNTCAADLKEQTAETLRMIGERDDYKKKLANASAISAEKDLEILRLNSQLDDYQKAKVFGERQSQSIIEVNTDEANDISKAIMKAKESWEEKANRGLSRWDLPALPPPAIEPVQPFRDEAATTEPTNDTIPTAEAPTLDLPSQFQGEDAGVELAVPTPGEQTEVSREEYTAAIKRLEELEKQVFGKVAA